MTIAWDDTVAIPDIAALHSFVRQGGAVGGVTLNVTRNQRLRLAAGGDFSFASGVAAGSAGLIDLRSKDYMAAGKVLLIEPATTSPQITCRVQINGCRGIYFRGLDFVGDCGDYGLDTDTWAPYTVQSITIISGGSGYVVGDTLTGTGGTREIAATVRVDAVDGSGAVTAAHVLTGGRLVTVAPTGWSGGTGTGFAATPVMWGASPRDTVTFIIQRNSSNPLLPVVVIDSCRFGPGFKTTPMTDPRQYASAVSASNAEQVSVIGCSFKGYQTGLNMVSVRRFRRHRNDFQLGIGDTCIALHTKGNLAVGSGQTYNQAFPDGLMYSWVRLETSRNLVDACAITNARGDDLRMEQEHTDFHQHGTSGDTGSYKSLVEYNVAYFERATYQDRNSSNPAGSTSPRIRVFGGAQGVYLDDAPSSVNIDAVIHDNLFVVCTQNQIVTYNGTSYVEQNTGARVGSLPPSATTGVDGFDYSTDVNATWGTHRISGGTANTYIANNIGGGVANRAAPQDATVTTSGNILADPRAAAAAGSTYAEVFAGSFGAGNTYTFDDTVSVSALRTTLAARFAGIGAAVGKGAAAPSLWPTT